MPAHRPKSTSSSRLSRGLVAAVLACGAAWVGAAEPYSLRQALNDALQRHPLLAQSEAERQAAQQLREAAEWQRFPTVSAEFTPGTTVSGGSSGGRVLRVDQPLWSGGRISGQIDAASAGERGAEVAQTEARRSLVEQVTLAYLAWSDTAQRLRLAEDGRSTFERLLAYVRRREAAGAASQADVSVAAARLAQVNAQREQLQGEQAKAIAELRTLVVGELGTLRPLRVPAPDPAAWAGVEERYVERSATLARRRTELDAARANAQVARGQALPTLLLRVEQQVSGVSGSSSAADKARALLALQFSPGAGLSSMSTAAAAESRANAVAQQLRADELTERLKARTHLADLDSAMRQRAELQPQVESLQQTADSYMRQFEAGRRAWLEVLNLHREVLDARLSLSRIQTQQDQGALRLLSNTGALEPWIATTEP